MKSSENEPTMKYVDDKAIFAARAAALRRFNDWEAKHPIHMKGEEALSGVGALYELMPPEARQRPSDPSGIVKMHQALSHLKGRT
jgi:hypothetical protein